MTSRCDWQDNSGHTALVALAARWLRADRACPVVLTEAVVPWAGTGRTGGEVVDAVGWKDGGARSILVECKKCRRDYRRQREKDEHGGRHVGAERYLLVPTGVVCVDDLPPGWGLLYVVDDRRGPLVRRVRASFPRESTTARDEGMELRLLYAALAGDVRVP